MRSGGAEGADGVDPERWLETMAALVGLDIPPECRDGVAHQLRLNRRLAKPLLRFEVPDGMPPAPRFEP
jgi:1-carboxybiuret hydrolase subunit AtzG-like protein